MYINNNNNNNTINDNNTKYVYDWLCLLLDNIIV